MPQGELACYSPYANFALHLSFLYEQVRVVKSAKDRSFEAIRTSISKIRNHIKINDWNGIQSDFDECNKHVEKSKVGYFVSKRVAVSFDKSIPSFRLDRRRSRVQWSVAFWIRVLKMNCVHTPNRSSDLCSFTLVVGGI